MPALAQTSSFSPPGAVAPLRGGAGLRPRAGEPLLERIGDLVDAGLGADLVLLAARRARHADRPDDVVADLDGQRALRCDDVRQPHQRELRIVLIAFGELARRLAEWARC